ncbi:MAG TPA: ATP-dependent DNA helicase, partial [Phenylobacterium sp.]|nr:ATP-dependent DNA helicase [Phenylobacterium sp.]
MNAPSVSLELAPALVVLPGPRAAVADGSGAQALRAPDARDLFDRGPVLVAHAAMSARRLGLNAPPRGPAIFDALELFAFVRPARFCLPTPRGVAVALGLQPPR